MIATYLQLGQTILMRFIKHFKPLIGAFLIVVIFQATGFMGTVSYYAQSAALFSGLLNADIEELTSPKKFNYDFIIKDLAGNKIKFDQFKGKVIFLNLWATWCAPCRAEMADIQNLQLKIKNDNVVFIMLSLDEDKNKAKVENYIHNKNFTFPVFMPSGYLPEQLQVPSIPTTFVISKDGNIIMMEVGTKNYDTKKFKKFLEEKAND